MKTLAVSALALAATGVTATAISARSGAVTSPRLTGVQASSPATACPRGATRARIGGRKRCLRVGQRCNPHFNATRPSYRRYGFFCASRASNEPPTLFRISRPGAAPTTCPGIGRTPTSTPPGIQGTWVGASPFWLGPYLKRDANLSVWRYAPDLPLKGKGGWAVKVIWLVARTIPGPARVSIADLASGRQLSITISGTYTDRSKAPLLDPARPSHPDVPDKSGTHEWGSYVVFPRAGCYRIEAQWPQGSWSLVFSFGR